MCVSSILLVAIGYMNNGYKKHIGYKNIVSHTFLSFLIKKVSVIRTFFPTPEGVLII